MARTSSCRMLKRARVPGIYLVPTYLPDYDPAMAAGYMTQCPGLLIYNAVKNDCSTGAESEDHQLIMPGGRTLAFVHLLAALPGRHWRNLTSDPRVGAVAGWLVKWA